jgi:predicted ester cyclase
MGTSSSQRVAVITGSSSGIGFKTSLSLARNQFRTYATMRNLNKLQVDPVRGMLRGPEEFIDTVKNLRSAFPNLHHEEESIITQDDMVVSIINVTGTHTGNFFILPPTGKNISYEAVHLYRIGEDGKIVEHKAIRDDLTFLAQLDIVGPTSPEYEPFFQALTGTSNS